MENSTASMVSTLVTFFLVSIPFLILNIVIARRKGKNPVKYGLLSLIPLVGFALAWYLISRTDKDLEDKINYIYEQMKGKQ